MGVGAPAPTLREVVGRQLTATILPEEGTFEFRISRRVRDCPRRSGQAIIETCMVMALTVLLFFGILQVARLFAAREVLDHAAARGARAKTVGFNRWMVEKSIRVASIPNAGRMITPIFDTADPRLQAEMQEASSSGDLWERLLHITPSSAQRDIERVRIPEYMASYNDARAEYILNYSDWDTIRGDHGDSSIPADDMVASPPRSFT
ncbi:MAG: pilus assembly protein [Verrucomicrobiota bacterium]|nr:pilus assembly protein [Verrucomicrobiota bacterium]